MTDTVMCSLIRKKKGEGYTSRHKKSCDGSDDLSWQLKKNSSISVAKLKNV
jgi:hypothetical protein